MAVVSAALGFILGWAFNKVYTYCKTKLCKTVACPEERDYEKATEQVMINKHWDRKQIRTYEKSLIMPHNSTIANKNSSKEAKDDALKNLTQIQYSFKIIKEYKLSKG